MSGNDSVSDEPFTRFPEDYIDFDDGMPASILTPNQREYFFGEQDISEASARTKLARIRRRIIAACWDLSLLIQVYPEEEMEKIRPDGDIRKAPLQSFAGFLYAMQSDNTRHIQETIQEGPTLDRDRRAVGMELDVMGGIARTIERREGVEADVLASIKVDRGDDLGALAQQDLHRLPRQQLDTLLHSGTIDKDDYITAIERTLEREEKEMKATERAMHWARERSSDDNEE